MLALEKLTAQAKADGAVAFMVEVTELEEVFTELQRVRELYSNSAMQANVAPSLIHKMLYPEEGPDDVVRSEVEVPAEPSSELVHSEASGGDKASPETE